MKQVDAFLRAMHKRQVTKEYYHLSFFAKLHHAEMTPLDQILSVSSDESPFDSEAERIMEERALKLLAERKAMQSV